MTAVTQTTQSSTVSASALADHTWVLCATRLSVDRVRAASKEAIASSPESPRCHFQGIEIPAATQAYTLVDSAVVLLSRLGELLGKARISAAQRVVALRSVLEERDSGALTQPFAEPLFPATQQAIVQENATNLLEFFDFLRFEQVEEAYLYSLIDEYGEVPLSRARAASVLSLLVRYQEYEQQLGSFDAASILERAIRVLSLLQESAIKWPQRIYVMDSALLRPLEVSYLHALSRHTEVLICEDRQLARIRANAGRIPYAYRFLAAPIQALSQELKHLECLEPQDNSEVAADERKQREALVEALFSAPGQEPFSAARIPETPGLERTFVWRCATPRAEVSRTMALCREGIKRGEFQPEDIQIVSFDLEVYRDVLEKEAAQQGLPLYVRKQRGFASSGIGELLDRFLTWVSEPTLDASYRLFEHPLALGLRPAGRSAVQDFITRNESQLSRLLAYDCLLSCLPSVSVKHPVQQAAEKAAGHASAAKDTSKQPLASIEILLASTPHLGTLQAFLTRAFLHLSEQPLFDRRHPAHASEAGEQEDPGVGTFETLLIQALESRLVAISAERTRNGGQTDTLIGIRELATVLSTYVAVLSVRREFEQSLAEVRDIGQYIRLLTQYFASLRRRARRPRAESTTREADTGEAERVQSEQAGEAGAEAGGEETFATALELHFAQDRKEYAAALYTCRGMFQQLRQQFSTPHFTQGGLEASTESFNGSHLELALQAIRIAAGEAKIPQETQHAAIWATEFLELRSAIRPVCIVLGCSSHAVKQWAKLDVFQSDLEATRTMLRRSEDRVLVQNWLFARTLEDATQLVFSYHEADTTTEYQPARELQRLVELGVNSSMKRDDAACLEYSFASEEEPRQEQQQKPSRNALSLLRARSSLTSFEYDGLCRPKNVYAALSSAPASETIHGPAIDDSLTLELSISALELYNDSPFGFFLERLLQLRPVASSVLEEISKHIGILVHSVLQEALGNPRLHSLMRSDEEAAARQLYAIGQRYFEQHPLDWDSHPFLRSRKALVLSGLGRKGYPGYLACALAIEQQHLQSAQPAEVEFRFRSALFSAEDIGAHHPPLYFRGTIDRIDGVLSENEMRIDAVWDYKTGKAPSARAVALGQSLQIPMYVLYCQKQFSLSPARAGVLSLSYQGAESDESSKANQSPVRVLLGAAKKKSLEEELTIVRAKITTAISQLLDADFQQQKISSDRRYHNELEILFSSDALRISRKQAARERGLSSDSSDLAAFREVRADSPGYAFLRPADAKEPKALSVEQEAACQLGVPICLRAGAGSGKTTVLQTRVLRLLKSGIPLGQILAITFTTKAAAEMRSRIERGIIDELGALARERKSQNALGQQSLFDQQGPEYDHLLRAMRELASMQVTTINSFCASLLGMAPELSGISRHSILLTESEAQQWQGQCLEETLVDSSIREHVDLALQYLQYSSDLEGLVFALARDPALRRDLVSGDLVSGEILQGSSLAEHEVSQENSQQELRLFLQQYLEYMQACEAESTKAWLAAWIRELEAHLGSPLTDTWKAEKRNAHEQVLAAASSFVSALGSEQEQACFDALSQIVAQYDAQKGNASKKDPRKFYIELKERLSRFANALHTEFDEVRFLEEMKVAHSLACIAESLSERYQARKRRRGVYDFDDQISIAHALLCTTWPTEQREAQQRFIERVRSSFSEILVDEFQDTNKTQWEIIKAIAGIATDPKKRTEHRPKGVFLVGDMQQSIYRFRGGDSRVFAQASDELRPHGVLNLELSDNYRSRPEIIAFINALFARLFSLDRISRLPIETACDYLAMKPQREQLSSPSPRVEIFVAAKSSARDEDEGDDEGFSPEVLYHVQQTKEILSSLADPTAESHYPGLTLSASEPQIAFLCRSRKQTALLAAAFDTYGVPYVMGESQHFFERDEIEDILLLLRALHDESDAIALVGVLRSPLAALKDDELLELALYLEHDWAAFWERRLDAHPKAATLRGRLREWRNRAVVCGVAKLLETILETEGILAAYEANYQSDCVQNCYQCGDSIRDAQRSGICGDTLESVIEWMELQRSGRAKIKQQVASAPVLISTIHASKGLEYPMVVVPFLDSGSRSSSKYYIADYAMRWTREWDRTNEDQADELRAKSLNRAQAVMELQQGTTRQTLGIATKFDREKGLAEGYSQLHDFSKEQVLGESSSEERRLFYVACTRATEYLILSYSEPKTGSKSIKDMLAANRDERMEFCRKSQSAAHWLRLLDEHLLAEGTAQSSEEDTARYGDIEVPIRRVS